MLDVASSVNHAGGDRSALPFVAEEDCFALKGGTAINLFVRDMPRLSVDIDLTYVPVAGRDESLNAIEAALKRIAERVRNGIEHAQVTESRAEDAPKINKLMIQLGRTQTKIEVTPVMRGCAYEPQLRSVSDAVEAAFGFAEIKVLSFADLYAGKIVAALDRQHPRDLFDIRDLLANEGIDDDMRRAFIVYMLCHTRPMHEVLTAKRKDISQEFVRGFEGMTAEPVSLGELSKALDQLVESIVKKMPDEHRKFLISFERGEPDWKLLGVDGAADLPAVKWRQQNLERIDKDKRAGLVTALERVWVE